MLKAVPPKGHKLTSEDIDRSISIMRSRIDKLGVTEPEIRKQGSNQIVIQLAGVHDPAQAGAIIGSTAQLELYDLETPLVPPSVPVTGNPIATRGLGKNRALLRSWACVPSYPTNCCAVESEGSQSASSPIDTDPGDSVRGVSRPPSSVAEVKYLRAHDSGLSNGRRSTGLITI